MYLQIVKVTKLSNIHVKVMIYWKNIGEIKIWLFWYLKQSTIMLYNMNTSYPGRSCILLIIILPCAYGLIVLLNVYFVIVGQDLRPEHFRTCPDRTFLTIVPNRPIHFCCFLIMWACLIWEILMLYVYVIFQIERGIRHDMTCPLSRHVLTWTCPDRTYPVRNTSACWLFITSQ
jgi:hypothetical protein